MPRPLRRTRVLAPVCANNPMMKIERLRFDLSRDTAAVVYDDGKTVPMSVLEALSIWQESRKRQHLRTAADEISSVDDLLRLLVTLSKKPEDGGEMRGD